MLRQQLQYIQHQSALHVVCKSKQQQHPIHLPFPGIESSIREYKKQQSNTSDEQDHGFNGNNVGIYPGDTMVLYGKSGTGKTYILSRMLNDTIGRQLDVVYIDLEHQYGSTMAPKTAAATVAVFSGSNEKQQQQQQQQQHVHLFRPRTDGDLLSLIYRLEKWFYDRAEDNSMNIAWVMIDGEWIMSDNQQQNHDLKRKLVAKLKTLQYHWPFALVTTYRSKVAAADGGIQQQSLTRYGQEYQFECYKLDQTICMKLVPPSSSNHAYSVDDLKYMVTRID